MLSSDSVDPGELCALAYQDSEVETSARQENYAETRLPARRKSPHKKLFLEPQDTDDSILNDDQESGKVSWRANNSVSAKVPPASNKNNDEVDLNQCRYCNQSIPTKLFEHETMCPSRPKRKLGHSNLTAS